MSDSLSSDRQDDLGPLTPKGVRTRTRILSEATALFAERGYANVRISDIAEASGLSNGALYRYFKDKDDLLKVLLGDLLSGFVLFAKAKGTEEVALDAICVATQRYLDFYREHRELYALLIEVAQHDASVREMWVASQKTLYGRIKRTLLKARSEGQIRSTVDVDLCSILLNGMTEQYAYYAFVLGQELDTDTLVVAYQITGIWAEGVFSADTKWEKFS